MVEADLRMGSGEPDSELEVELECLSRGSDIPLVGSLEHWSMDFGELVAGIPVAYLTERKQSRRGSGKAVVWVLVPSGLIQLVQIHRLAKVVSSLVDVLDLFDDANGLSAAASWQEDHTLKHDESVPEAAT